MNRFADDEEDPEVIADLRLRARTERERRPARETLYDWKPPVFVGKWKCRRPACATFVEITEQAMHAFCVANDELRRRGEKPLDKDAIVWCATCHAEYKRGAPQRRQGQIERMAVVIKQLKEAKDPERERGLVEQLREWGHPDVDGLVRCLVEKRVGSSGRAGKRREL